MNTRARCRRIRWCSSRRKVYPAPPRDGSPCAMSMRDVHARCRCARRDRHQGFPAAYYSARVGGCVPWVHGCTSLVDPRCARSARGWTTRRKIRLFARQRRMDIGNADQFVSQGNSSGRSGPREYRSGRRCRTSDSIVCRQQRNPVLTGILVPLSRQTGSSAISATAYVLDRGDRL